jgi:hypothetical protein
MMVQAAQNMQQVPPQEDPSVSQSRPDTGTLNEGSLGPRMKRFDFDEVKSLNTEEVSFYDRVRRACKNGNH